MATPKKRHYTIRTLRAAYSITLPNGKVIDIMESANAWWMDRGKVANLVAAFGIDASVEEACAYAEVSARQYKYFLEVHPEFKEVRHILTELSILRARRVLMRELDKGNYKMGMKYLEIKRPKEFGPPSRRKKELPYEQMGKPVFIAGDRVMDIHTRKFVEEESNPKKDPPEEQKYTTVFKG